MAQRLGVAFACLQTGQRSLEVIDDWKELQQHVVPPVLIEFAAFALHPLSVILKLSLPPDQFVIQRSPLGSERIDLGLQLSDRVLPGLVWFRCLFGYFLFCRFYVLLLIARAGRQLNSPGQVRSLF